MKLAIPAFIALVLIGITTFYQGTMSERWNQDELARELEAASKRVDSVPLFVGDWKGVDEEADETQLEAAHAVGSLTREFRNVRTGEKLSFFVICGKPRHVAIHTPDDCYVASGFEMLSRPEVVEVETEDGPVTFRTTVFKKIQGDTAHHVRVYWAWNEDGTWEAPEYPRLAYAWGPSLYKMYIISNGNSSGEEASDDDNPAIRFMKAIVPATNEALFPTADAPPSSADAKPEQARSTSEQTSTPEAPAAG